MADKIHLRCSQLPRFMLCPSSAIPVRNPIFEPEPEFNDPAELGTAVHVALKEALEAMTADEDPDIDWIAKQHNVDHDDLGRLHAYGIRCWESLREHFGDEPIVENAFTREFPTFILTGHPDAVSDPSMKIIAVMDWKTGRVEYYAAWQLFGAALFNGATRGVVVWLRETWTGEPFEVVEIPSESAIITSLEVQVGKMHAGECTTGPHCTSMYCDRRHECEAYQGYVRGAVASLVELDDNDTLPAPEIVARGYHAWKEYEALSARFKLLMNEVLDAQGEIILPGGEKKLVRLTTHPKVFNAEKTLAVMTGYGIENPAECFKVAVTKMEKAIKDTAKAAGAKKGARYAAFLDDCEEVGALTYGERKTRKEVRV